VTICTRDRECLFGHVVNGEIRLNDAGEIARRCWEDIPDHLSRVVLDAGIIVPNHIHGIIVVRESRRGEASATPIRLFKEPRESDASPLRTRSPRS
jgi:putative transposase